MSIGISDLSIRASEIIALLGILITLGIFLFQQFRLVKVQKQQTYQRLELASNELFRFGASHAGVLVRYQALEKDTSIVLTETERVVADSHIFQTLNLFEMAARLRRGNFFEDEVFGSWVVWYYDLLQSWYFRETWRTIRPNYTTEMRLVFDKPVESFDPQADNHVRKKQFFAHVAKVLHCPHAKNWLDDMA